MTKDEFPSPQEPTVEHVSVGVSEDSGDHQSVADELPNPPSAMNLQSDSGAPSAPQGRGKLAAIGGGLAAAGLVLGLLIGWFAFDDGGSSDSRKDRGGMSQDQGGGRGHQDGGRMGPGKSGRGGQMMPGDDMPMQPGMPMDPGTMTPQAPTTPSTQGSTVPQGLQQG